nr:26s proteasome regulatory subunit rpn11 [Quercus suber]
MAVLYFAAYEKQYWTPLFPSTPVTSTSFHSCSHSSDVQCLAIICYYFNILADIASIQDTNIVDNAETVYISSLALLKMLRHGRAGVPMEVMGLMLGEFVDDYTVRVVDVFAMPQSGTGVSVEAVDPVFQTKMMDMLRQTGSVDINTQQSFEQLTPRAVAVVIDPIQSVKGKVVIDAFRLINPQTLMLGQEPRQTTSNLGHLNKPSIQALIHGLNRHYYSIGIGYRKTALEEGMLMNLHKTVWTEALTMPDFATEGERNHANLQKLVSLAEGYEKRVKEETELTKEQLRTRYVGKVDPKKHIEAVGQALIEDNIVSVSRQMIDKEASVPSAFEAKANGASATRGTGTGDVEGMQVDDEDD